MQDLSRDLIDSRDRVTVLQVQLESSKDTDTPPGETPTSSDPPAAPLTSSSPSSAGNAFVPLTADDARVQSVQLLSQFGEAVTEMVAGLSDLHTYWEHR